MTSTQSTGSRPYLLSSVLVAIIGGLLFGYDTATVLEHDKNLLKIKWDKWGIETFIRQDNGQYILSDEKE